MSSMRPPFPPGRAALSPRSALRDLGDDQTPISSLGESRPALHEDALMADASHLGVLLVRGQGASSLLDAGLGGVPRAVGEVVQSSRAAIASRRPDEFELICPSFQLAKDLAASLEERSVQGLISILEVSHGRAGILLAGPKGPEILRSQCALDFSHSHFPDLRFAQAAVARIRASILRRDRAGIPIYYLGVDRSLGAYLWGVLLKEMERTTGLVLGAEGGRGAFEGWPVP